MTRTSDELLDQTKRPQRAQSFYGKGSDVIVLSNHLNAGGGDGAEIIYSLRNSDNLARKIANEFENAGQNVRKYYQRRLPSNPAKDYYYLLRDTPNNETLIVEYGFTDSSGDDVNLIKNNWQGLAEAVVKALTGYIGVPYSVKGDNYYTVKKGDSLWSIAKKFNTSVDNLKNINNLSTNNLTIGQKLIVEKDENILDINGTKYVVNSGDTLYSIAKKYNTTVDTIKKANKLASNNLSIGQELIIDNTTSNNDDSYIVKLGDTLYAIASKYNTTSDILKKLNNLSSNNLSIGQILKIPTSVMKHIVEAGDTLYSIAKKYNKTIDEIKTANNLLSDILSIGQELIIP